MDFRPLTPADLDDGPDWFGQIALRPDRWRDEHTRSLVAEVDGAPVAAGIIWTSRVHGDRYWASVVVAPERRRQRIGISMAAALAERRAQPLPLMTRGFVGTDELAFADALGARTIQIVPPMEVDVTRRDGLRQALPQTVAGDAVGLERLGEAWARTYEWTHADWSPTGPRFADALLEGFAEEVDLGASSATLGPDGEITAVCLVFADEPPVLCGEATSRDVPGGERLVESCLRRSLDVLAARGVTAVEMDGHVSDPHWLPAWIRLSPTGRWFRLVELYPDGGA